MRHPSDGVLALFAGGDLPVIDRLRTAWHVRRCARCAGEVDAYQRVCAAAAGEAGMPAGLDWERVAAEMTANIRLGVAAGECVAPSPCRQAPGFAWRGAAAVASLSAMLAGAWYFQRAEQPGSSARLQAPHIEMRTTPGGLELEENGSTMVLLHGRGGQADRRTIISSTPGSLRARYVDAETGQITITNVYVE